MIKIKFHNKTLKETPLHDIVDYNNHDDYEDFGTESGEPDFYPRQSAIAHKASPEFKAHAKLLWKDSEHNWILITPAIVNGIPERPGRKEKLVSWIRAQNFPSPSKILVVVGSPLDGDFRSAEWQTGHDIIGHTIDIIALKETGGGMVYDAVLDSIRQEKSQKNLSLNIKATDVFVKVWKLLPPEFQISVGSMEDIVPDILFGIFAKKLNRQDVFDELSSWFSAYSKKRENGIEIAKTVVEILFGSVQKFIEMVPDDEPFFVQPF